MAKGRTFSWQSPDGGVYPFSRANGLWVLEGVTGLGKPVYNIDLEAKSGQDSSLLRGVRAASRTIFLPVDMSSDSRDNFLKLAQTTSQSLDPESGPGYLIIHDGSGYYRIQCIYSGGLEGEEGGTASGESSAEQWAKKGLLLTAISLFFESMFPVVQSFGYVSGATPFFPILPLRLATNTVSAMQSINNPGTKFSWPTITVTGPGTSIDLWHRGRDLHVTLQRTINDGEVITVDMENLQIRSTSGVRLYRYLTSDDAWALDPGLNDISLTLNGAAAGSNVTVSFRPRYESIV